LQTEITSKDNSLVKEYKLLQSQHKQRSKSGLFVIEGLRLCFDILSSGTVIKCIFYTKSILNSSQGITNIIERAEKSVCVSDSIASHMSDTKSPQGVFCICTANNSRVCSFEQGVLILEDISDPNNMGTILRTAEALGVFDIVLTDNCCDIFSPKVLRGSMGAVVRLNFHFTSDLPLLIHSLIKKKYTVVASVVSCEAQSIRKIPKIKKTAIVIGNEANGLTKDTVNACTAKATIPMKGNAESLNAAVAAAIILYELCGQEIK